MRTVSCYRDLDVWKKSIALVCEVYRVTKSFPNDERFGLTNQLRRATTSIPANIAEGAEREGTKEFLQFLSIAAGSLAEVETFLTIAEQLQYLASAEYQQLSQETATIGRMLNGLKRALRSSL